MKKKIFTLILSLLTAVSLCACGDENSQTSAETSKTDAIISLGDYHNLTTTVERTEPSEEEVESWAEYFYNQDAAEMDWNKTAELGDTVIIDFIGTLNGIAFDGGTASDYSLTLGTHTFIEGFEEGLVGINAGESRDLNLTFPENYGNADLAGKETVFNVTCKKVIPHMTEENVACIQSDLYSNLDELKEITRKNLISEKEIEYKDNVLADVLNQILENTEFGPIPVSDVASTQYQLNQVYSQYAEVYGMDAETFAQQIFGHTLKEEAENTVKLDLIIKKIAELEGLTVSDAELKKGAEEFVEQTYGDAMTADEFLEANGEDMFREYILQNKVHDLLLSNVK